MTSRNKNWVFASDTYRHSTDERLPEGSNSVVVGNLKKDAASHSDKDTSYVQRVSKKNGSFRNWFA